MVAAAGVALQVAQPESTSPGSAGSDVPVDGDHDTGNDPPVLETGEHVLPGFQVIRHLSRGRDTDVYDAWSWDRSCACVVKMVRPDRVDHEPARIRARSESQILSKLTHPNIVRMYDRVEGDNSVTVLERLDGISLHTMVHSVERLIPWPEIMTWAGQLCAALGYLHRVGYLHLDVKPLNVVIVSGDAVLIDFHLSRPPGPCPRELGTRRYMAPEQARGEQVTSATDVWGLGTTLYEAASGRAPFENPDDGPQQLTTRAAPVRDHRTMPSSLGVCIDACLDPDPANRPTLDQVVHHLHA